MGVFVSYLNNPFSDLKNDATTILATGALTEPHTLIVNGLRVRNKGLQPIRFSLQQIKTTTTTVTTTVTTSAMFEIAPNETIDLVKNKGLQIFLDYRVISPTISEALVCFSNGITQIFDCVISYTRLNETPIN